MRYSFISGLMAFALCAGPALAQEPPRGPVCDPVFEESGIEPYGRIVSVRPGQRIKLPDFTLKTVTAKHEYLLRSADGTTRQLTIPAENLDAGVLEFAVGDRHYVLETRRTVIFGRLLAANELVVWPRDDYRVERARHAVR